MLSMNYVHSSSLSQPQSQSHSHYFSWKEDGFMAPEVAVKYTYERKGKQWRQEKISVQLRPNPISEGTNRRVFLFRDLSLHGDKQRCVAKVSKELTEGRKEYFADVIMQAKCIEYAEEFNSRNPPKKISFLQPCVIELVQRPHDRTGGHPLMMVEPFLEGNYLKHSNNWGFVDPADRNTPQAFSHFTYNHSKGTCIVVDIQGVNDIYTDPQIHSNQPTELPPVYGQGDMASQGIAKFFESHRCNVICSYLGLPSTSPRGSFRTNMSKGTVVAGTSNVVIAASPQPTEPAAGHYSRTSSLGSISSEDIYCKKAPGARPPQLDTAALAPCFSLHNSPYAALPSVYSFSSPMLQSPTTSFSYNVVTTPVTYVPTSAWQYPVIAL